MSRTAVLLSILSLSGLARAQDPLPVVSDVEWKPLRAHARDVLQALDALKSPLPTDTDRAVRALLKDEPKDAADRLQELLDAHCLVGVTINPESRVKAARGPAAAELRQGKEAVFLVKVHNDAGVTNALAVSGDQVRSGKGGEGQWLEAAVHAAAPLGKTLDGAKVQYVVVRLKADEAGKREATLRFDVGQGTQDLGFRAEVPVLFTIRKEL